MVVTLSPECLQTKAAVSHAPPEHFSQPLLERAQFEQA